jgi:hypothetical protein
MWWAWLVLVPMVAAASGLAAQPSRPSWLDSLEVRFDSTRHLADQLSVTNSRGAQRSIHGVPVARLEQDLAAALTALKLELDRARPHELEPGDQRALSAIRSWYSRAERAQDRPEPATTESPACDYDPLLVSAGENGTGALQDRIFACYSWAAGQVVVDQDTLDRLSILSLLGTTEDRSRRERLFRALGEVWSSVNRSDEETSPYRVVLRRRRAAWAGGPTPMSRRVERIGVSADTVERWLVRSLEAWRATLPDTTFEPWDYYHYVGTAGRRLGPRIPRDSLLTINQRFYRALGADPESLGVRYDLEPRAGKYPIAFTDFGGRSIERGGRWTRSEPWVFTSYRIGGLDNLSELLHETGHAVHIAAIRARPAFHDWPDSDTFTEGIADLAAWEIYEPAWQHRFLGDSVSLKESLRSKYAGIMLDMAWALFEFRVHRSEVPSPNQVWTDITRQYFKIRPHPELSWWAIRGQLIESPGYLLNYALGAYLVADLRRALIERHGPFTTGRASWYGEVSAAVYRFGRERPAALVIADVLGRELTSDALLADLRRAAAR